jgi:hypothetical protein
MAGKAHKSLGASFSRKPSIVCSTNSVGRCQVWSSHSVQNLSVHIHSQNQDWMHGLKVRGDFSFRRKKNKRKKERKKEEKRKERKKERDKKQRSHFRQL